MFVLYRLDSAIPWYVTLLARRLLDATTDARDLAHAEHQHGTFALVDSRCGTHWTFSLPKRYWVEPCWERYYGFLIDETEL